MSLRRNLVRGFDWWLVGPVLALAAIMFVCGVTVGLLLVAP